MSTSAQLTANALNAQASSGPVTSGGKSNSARNALKLGLFTMEDFVLPHETAEYTDHSTRLWAYISPANPMEEAFAAEIVSATWSLRRCRRVEADLSLTAAADPFTHNDESALRIQTSVERARSQANNTLRRSTAELRRLQTDRVIRDEIFYDQPVPNDAGLASYGHVANALVTNERHSLLAMKVEERKLEAALNAPLPNQSGPAALPQPADKPAQTSKLASFCKTAEPSDKPAPTTPRNAPCPCQSGMKFKRCCGKDAPAVLGKAA